MVARQNKSLNFTAALFYLIALALCLRIGIGVFVTNRYDTYWYRQWILDFPNGFFDIYSRADAIALDYPPLFLVLVYPISLLYKIVPPNTYEMADMLFLKLVPILFDVATCLLFYHIGKKENSAEMGLVAAAFWAMNPSMFFNSAIWGQTDSVMCFVLLAAFYLLYRNRRVASTLMMAAACMIKFQCLFFAPVWLMGMVDSCGIGTDKSAADNLAGAKKLGICAGVGAAAVAAVFLPFAVMSRDITLFPGIYFSSGGKYPYCTLNAFNFYGALGLNWVDYSSSVFGSVTMAHLGYIITALGIALLAVAWIFSKKRCIFVAGFFLMQHIFMFMPAMHERYQVAVLPFCIAVWIIRKDKRFAHISVALTVFTLVNQLIVLANATKGMLPWAQSYNQLMSILSLVNLAIYIWSAVLCVAYLMQGTDTAQETKEV